MARYTVHMTFRTPAQRGPYGALPTGRLAAGRGKVQHVAADGTLAGVREPRRPSTPPGTMSAALD